ncbi:site-specific integrase [Halorubrum yunnanense]|uniref:Site-specific integrase n=1 Tax=Halorubrum yunnanense TaxID=1526162 RepID=A0ABD5YKT1_9EURY|nr:site-specific integrase [Halorubrum yunnanense]
MVRITDDSGTYTKCILDPYEDELEKLEAAARREDWEREVAVQLMGRCGLRADEVTYPTRERLQWSSSGECWLLEVQGKDTSGGEGKTRDAWVPEDVAENIQRFVSERNRDPDAPIVSVSTSSIRRWVREAARQLAEEGERWARVSSHDLRRSWATYHMVEQGTDVRTMMSIGGWSNYDAIEPYLGEPTEAKIGRSMSA